MKPKILIIDGHLANLDSVSKALQKSHFTTFAAISFKEGWHMARETLPDLVLISLSFSQSEISQALRKLRRDPTAAALKLVALVGSGLEDRQIAARAGFDDCLARPTQPGCFASAVVRLIARSRRKWESVSRQNLKLCGRMEPCAVSSPSPPTSGAAAGRKPIRDDR